MSQNALRREYLDRALHSFTLFPHHRFSGAYALNSCSLRLSASDLTPPLSSWSLLPATRRQRHGHFRTCRQQCYRSPCSWFPPTLVSSDADTALHPLNCTLRPLCVGRFFVPARFYGPSDFPTSPATLRFRGPMGPCLWHHARVCVCICLSHNRPCPTLRLHWLTDREACPLRRCRWN